MRKTVLGLPPVSVRIEGLNGEPSRDSDYLLTIRPRVMLVPPMIQLVMDVLLTWTLIAFVFGFAAFVLPVISPVHPPDPTTLHGLEDEQL
jgi:hypothetical protein